MTRHNRSLPRKPNKLLRNGGRSKSITACGEQNIMSNAWFASPVRISIGRSIFT